MPSLGLAVQIFLRPVSAALLHVPIVVEYLDCLPVSADLLPVPIAVPDLLVSVLERLLLDLHISVIELLTFVCCLSLSSVVSGVVSHNDLLLRHLRPCYLTVGLLVFHLLDLILELLVVTFH